jgi:hypothetical protein
MKFLGITFLVLLAGCHTTEDISDELTDAQRAAIDSYAAQRCITSTATRYDNFETISGRVWQSDSAKWQRHYGWKFLLKQGETTMETQEIRVWRNTGDDLYLYVRSTVGSVDTKYYLRLPLTLNATLIEDVQYQGCYNFDPIIITVSGSDNGPLVAKKVVTEQLVPGTRVTTTSFTFKFDAPAFAGGAWNFTRSVVISGANTSAHANGTTTMTGSLTEWTGNANLSDTPESGAKYCDVLQASEVDLDHPTLEYKLPFGVNSLGSCAATAAGWIGF